MSTPTPTGPTPTPPGGELLPLISLAVEHVFDTLGRQSVFAPTILAVAADGQRGMWEHPDLEPEQAAATVATISPRPTRAVAVFDGEVETADGPRPAVAVEAFDAAALASTRMVFPYLPGVAAAGIAARVDGDPQVVANGPNPLFG